MKKIIIAIFVLSVAACGGNSDKKASTDSVNNSATAENPEAIDENGPALTFTENMFDFGTINEGEKVTHQFVFKNTGKSDLLISNAAASCGCTIPTWPKEPIKPGAEAMLDVTFNSEGKPGHVEKTVTVTANTRPVETIVLIKGEVTPKTNNNNH
jgi:hypothetical protein